MISFPLYCVAALASSSFLSPSSSSPSPSWQQPGSKQHLKREGKRERRREELFTASFLPSKQVPPVLFLAQPASLPVLLSQELVGGVSKKPVANRSSRTFKQWATNAPELVSSGQTILSAPCRVTVLHVQQEVRECTSFFVSIWRILRPANKPILVATNRKKELQSS